MQFSTATEAAVSIGRAVENEKLIVQAAEVKTIVDQAVRIKTTENAVLVVISQYPGIPQLISVFAVVTSDTYCLSVTRHTKQSGTSESLLIRNLVISKSATQYSTVQVFSTVFQSVHISQCTCLPNLNSFNYIFKLYFSLHRHHPSKIFLWTKGGCHSPSWSSLLAVLLYL